MSMFVSSWYAAGCDSDAMHGSAFPDRSDTSTPIGGTFDPLTELSWSDSNCAIRAMPL
jgi:hypothetical protein